MDFAFLYKTGQFNISRITVRQRNRRIHSVDSSVPLTQHDPKDLGLIRLVKKRKIHFWILSDLKLVNFLKEAHPKSLMD